MRKRAKLKLWDRSVIPFQLFEKVEYNFKTLSSVSEVNNVAIRKVEVVLFNNVDVWKLEYHYWKLNKLQTISKSLHNDGPGCPL